MVETTQLLKRLFPDIDLPADEELLVPLEIRLGQVERDRKLQLISEEKRETLKRKVVEECLSAYHTWRAVQDAKASGIPVKTTASELGIPVRSVYRYGLRKPLAISEDYFTSSVREVKTPTFEEGMNLIEEYAVGLLDNDLQNVIFLGNPNFFNVSYKGRQIGRILRASGLLWYQALIHIFVERPLERGEQPLIIYPFEEPLQIWMYRNPIVNRWKNPNDRFQALNYLFFNHWKQVPPKSEFSNPEIPLGYSLSSLLTEIEKVYQRYSHIVALIEAGCIDSETFQRVREHSRPRAYSLHDVISRAFLEFLRNGNSVQHIAGLYKIPPEVVRLAINSGYREGLGRRLEEIYDRFSRGLKRGSYQSLPVPRTELEGVHQLLEDTIPILAERFGYPEGWFRELHKLQTIMSDKYTPYYLS